MVSLALILIVCVAASTIVMIGRMNNFLLDDEGAISIITENPVNAEEILTPTEETEETEETEGTEGTENGQQNSSGNKGKVYSSSYFSGYVFEMIPGFEVVDENDVIWGEETKVEIFRTSYENGEGVITAKSDDGEKIVAPGTDNSYTFKLKNTGNVPVKYWLDVDAYITPGDKMIPIESRLNR